MQSINTNTSALQSMGNINAVSSSINQSLTSGSKINGSADDAASQVIISEFSKQINTQNVATPNANTGSSLLQTAGGATDQISQQTQQLLDLSNQAMNGTYTDSQRAALNEQFQNGIKTIAQLAENTQFNGINLLNSDTSNVSLALGTGTDNSYNLNLPDLTPSALGLNAIDITNPANALGAQNSLTDAMDMLSKVRSDFVARQDGLVSAVSNLNTQNLSAFATRSQMNDTDFTRAFSEQIKQQLISDASTAMQAQGNQNKGQVLQLLA